MHGARFGLDAENNRCTRKAGTSLGMPTRLRTAEPRTRWVIVSLLVVIINVVLIEYTVGECIDYTAESGAV